MSQRNSRAWASRRARDQRLSSCCCRVCCAVQQRQQQVQGGLVPPHPSCEAGAPRVCPVAAHGAAARPTGDIASCASRPPRDTTPAEPMDVLLRCIHSSIRSIRSFQGRPLEPCTRAACYGESRCSAVCWLWRLSSGSVVFVGFAPYGRTAAAETT